MKPLKEAFRLKYVHVPLSEVMPLRHIRAKMDGSGSVRDLNWACCDLLWSLPQHFTRSILLHFLRHLQTPGYRADWHVSPALSLGVSNSADHTLPGSQLQPVITPTARPSPLWSLTTGDEQWEEWREKEEKAMRKKEVEISEYNHSKVLKRVDRCCTYQQNLCQHG